MQNPAPFDAQSRLRKIKTRQGMVDYLDVKHRVLWIRSEHPDACIITETIYANGSEALVKATISYNLGDRIVMATGHGSETAEDFPSGHIEKAETKAIGRACATLGYGTDAAPDLDDGEPLDGAGAAKDERAARGNPATAQPTPIRPQPGKAMEAIREVSGAHTLDVRPDTKPSPRAQQQEQQATETRPPNVAAYPNAAPRPCDTGTVVTFLRAKGFGAVTDLKSAISEVNEWVAENYPGKSAIVGTGQWDDKWKQYKVFPSDIYNCAAYYLALDPAAGASEAKAAEESESDNWDDVPF